MTSWPVCPLCQEETSYLDSHGLCQRVSITHAAVRTPEEFPADQHPELWKLIMSGRPVFGTRYAVTTPTTLAEAA